MQLHYEAEYIQSIFSFSHHDWYNTVTDNNDSANDTIQPVAETRVYV